MKTNFFKPSQVTTFNGARSVNVSPLQKLKRLTMACMLWEDNFYVDGKTTAEQIQELCAQIDGDKLVQLAVDCSTKGQLRHMPLYLIVQALKKQARCIEAIDTICNRPDQMTELLSLYWKDGKKPLSAQLKKGLAKAFTKYDEYQLSKYNRDNPIKLRDVLFLCHAKPKDSSQEELWKRLISNGLSIAETWESKLSSGADKKDSFQELLSKGKMGKLAILRNLRNMFDSGVPKDLVESELMRNGRPILPFQFLAAAKACPQWEDIVDKAMIKSAQEKEKLKGLTVILVDVSGSMDQGLAGKSQMTRMEAACGLAILLKEVSENYDMFSFSDQIKLIPPRSGMALRDAIITSQPHSGTYLGVALNLINTQKKAGLNIDRIIVITDEQTNDVPPAMKDTNQCYVVNVGTYQNGIFNNGQWHTINGFSEHVVDYIIEYEKEEC